MKHVSTLDLHQLHLDELPPERLDEVRAHLATCERCAARLGVVQAEAGAFDAALPAELRALHQARAPASPAHWLVYLRRLGPAAAALAAAALLFVALPAMQGGDEPGEETRTRGELPQLEVWVAAPQGPRPLRKGEALAEGDRVQLLFDARGAQRVGLAGRDGDDVIEVYGVLTPTADGLQPAPFGLALDDAPGPQVFYAVPGGADLDALAVEKAIRQVPLPEGVQSVTVAKRGGRR